MKNNNKKLFIWSRWADDIILGTKPPDGQGGAELQMLFWAKSFADQGYIPYLFSWRLRVLFREIYGIKFLWLPWVRKLGVVFAYLRYLYVLIYRPNLIIIRGYTDLKVLLRLKKVVDFRILLMIASDLEVENESNQMLNLSNYVDGIITQNHFQYNKIVANFPKIKTINVHNIFDNSIFSNTKVDENFDFIWVGNIKPVKRVMYFLDLAMKMPNKKFGIIGKNQNETEFQLFLDRVKDLNNVKYLGFLDIQLANNYISNSRILVNTSIKEGFPNTFLQAWSYNIPVISNVDPSDLISKNDLGLKFNNFDELVEHAELLIDSTSQYQFISKKINEYFIKSHSPKTGLETILNAFFN
ncbi:MAG: glycosyltransferase family 4 protein [Bacteroidia bacterium]|nr:glycosyltransferase family 4 protein [Bacteroidia bacterium]